MNIGKPARVFGAMSIVAAFGCSPTVVVDGNASGVGGGTTNASTGGGAGNAATGGGTTIAATGVGGSVASSSSAGAGGSFACRPPNEPAVVIETTDIIDSRLIAIDDTFVYWTDSALGNIIRASLCSQATNILVTGESAPIAVVVDAEHLVWGTAADDGELRIAPIAGGSATTLWHGAPVHSLAIDGSRIYFAGWIPGGIYAIDEDGSNLVELFTGDVGQGNLAIDDENVYFVSERTLNSVPKIGGAVTELRDIDTDIEGTVAAGNGDVFLSILRAPNDAVVAIPRAGGATTSLATGNGITTLATTATELVWMGDDGLYAAPIGGGAPKTLSHDAGQALVARDGAVAWTDSKLIRWMALP